MKRYGWIWVLSVLSVLLFSYSISFGAISSEDLITIKELKASFSHERGDNEKRRVSVLENAKRLAPILPDSLIIEFKNSSFEVLDRAKEIIDGSEKLITDIPNNISQGGLAITFKVVRLGLITVMEADVLVMKKEKRMLNKGIVMLDTIEKLEKIDKE